jgi:hypothetical protein
VGRHRAVVVGGSPAGRFGNPDLVDGLGAEPAWCRMSRWSVADWVGARTRLLAHSVRPGRRGDGYPSAIEQEEQVKSREEIMEILEAFDLTGSFRDAGELAGCSHHTVAATSPSATPGELPDDGPSGGSGSSIRSCPRSRSGSSGPTARSAPMCAFDKLSGARLRRLGPHGPPGGRGGEGELPAGRRRVYRPWIPEPGMWAQWDWGTGPTSAGGRRCCSVRGWRGRGSGW